MGFVKVQSTKNNITNISNLLKNFVLGDKNPSEHSESATYNTGDMVYIVVDGKVSMYEATRDGITGPFVESDWSTYTLDNSIGGGLFVAEVSDTQPTNPSNNMWLKPIREATYNLPPEFN